MTPGRLRGGTAQRPSRSWLNSNANVGPRLSCEIAGRRRMPIEARTGFSHHQDYSEVGEIQDRRKDDPCRRLTSGSTALNVSTIRR